MRKFVDPSSFPLISRFGLTFLLTGLSCLAWIMPAQGSDDSKRIDKLNGGYYLLHQLALDESQLPMLTVVKHTPAEIKGFADHVSEIAKDTVATIEHMRHVDASIRYDQNPLPEIEKDVRASIAQDKQHQLVFGTTDSEFVRTLLESQIEAASYGTNLAKVLAEQEKNPLRVRALQQVSAQWLIIRKEAFRLLRNYSV